MEGGRRDKRRRQNGEIGGVGSVPDHDGGRPMEVNACILITHMVNYNLNRV